MSPHDDSGASSSRSTGHSFSFQDSLKNGDSRNSLKIANIINGSSTPSSTPPTAPKGKYCGHDREEVTRILIQALGDMGHEKIANDLAAESGYCLETPTVSDLRAYILQGSWPEAENLIVRASTHESPANRESNNLILKHDADKDSLIFQIRQQKFFELLESGNTGLALLALRTDLTPLVKRSDESRLNFLASLLMCSSPESLKQKGDLPDTVEEARQKLLASISLSISPSVMLPEQRLATLFSNLVKTQTASCMYHTDTETPSLLEDHECSQDRFPNQIALELEDLSCDEVWQVKFNNSGTQLAACGKTGRLVIWDTADFRVVQNLVLHETGIENISWSPNDTKLVTCSVDKTAKLLDATTGNTIRKLLSLSAEISSCVWAPDGQSFVISSLDKDKPLVTFNSAGDIISEWDKGHRVQDMCLSADGRYIVALNNYKHIYVYNRESTLLVNSYQLSFTPLSIATGSHPDQLLINSQLGEVHCVDLMTGVLLRTYVGHTASEYIIRTNFGGANEGYVVSGSDDKMIYVWHRSTGVLIERLSGHTQRANSVCFNPRDPTMIASCGDDGVVRIWTNFYNKPILIAAHEAIVPDSVQEGSPNGHTHANGHTRLGNGNDSTSGSQDSLNGSTTNTRNGLSRGSSRSWANGSIDSH
ncbi:putative WD repeat-containing protein [Ceratocystis fimbriata CBS 114723]|uniref:Putative WD repeat-containing protein n=1 Tax=Ceratocystis fimbriata CBS 114723 TaxID=1035309 RepID=A0A2C5X6P3_9PEZI|nr:putative WD repeat-containing protein [Ceratocystis fimbriata CBS 114723]